MSGQIPKWRYSLSLKATRTKTCNLMTFPNFVLKKTKNLLIQTSFPEIVKIVRFYIIFGLIWPRSCPQFSSFGDVLHVLMLSNSKNLKTFLFQTANKLPDSHFKESAWLRKFLKTRVKFIYITNLFFLSKIVKMARARSDSRRLVSAISESVWLVVKNNLTLILISLFSYTDDTKT